MPKSFVSLSFSPKKLQILQLNSQKTALAKLYSIDLPDRLICNYRVQDEKALSSLIIQSWAAAGFKEQFVGIVVPEFSTFTKSLILPNLKPEELDEAVRWQARDFLPESPKNVVMDWKIVSREKNHCRVLVVAILKKVLSGYVDAVELAGLFPLLAETPSLSLERIADGDPTGRLIIYTNFGEAILVMVAREEILASSVISSSDRQSILWTVEHMLRFYQKEGVKRIEISGLEVTQELMVELQNRTKLPIHWVQVNIAGMSAEQIQEYLMPLSLQLKDPAEPLDENTVNLLPHKWAKFYNTKKLKFRVWSLLSLVSVVVISCFLATIGLYFFISRQLLIFKKAVEDHKAAIPQNLMAKINNANNLADKIIKISDSSYSPQGLIDKINKVLPSGVAISNYNFDLDKGKIKLKGSADTRDNLIRFKQELEKENDISKVTVPISNLENELDIFFEMEIIYGLKNNQKITIPIK